MPQKTCIDWPKEIRNIINTASQSALSIGRTSTIMTCLSKGCCIKHKSTDAWRATGTSRAANSLRSRANYYLVIGETRIWLSLRYTAWGKPSYHHHWPQMVHHGGWDAARSAYRHYLYVKIAIDSPAATVSAFRYDDDDALHSYPSCLERSAAAPVLERRSISNAFG